MKVPDDKKQNRLATVKRGSGLAKKANGLSACWNGLNRTSGHQATPANQHSYRFVLRRV